MKKIVVTDTYLKNILQALEDAKGYFDMWGMKNTYQKHIYATKKKLELTEK
jgi:hypothetical protein